MNSGKSLCCASRYLNVLPLEDGDGFLLFNGTNGCLDEAPQELGEMLKNNDAALISALPDDTRETLLARGHITFLSPEEEKRRFRDFVSALHERRLADKSGFGGVMLLLSYNCNLNCPYCFQQEYRKNRPRSVMTAEMVDAIFNKHIEHLLPDVPLREVTLYGGEPLLPAHEPAIRAALEHAKNRKLFVKAISNATTSIERVIDMFGPENGRINWVQISLDGTRSQHDKSRIPESGKPTFDKILSNITLLIQKGTKISIRLNLDRKKAASLPELLEELKSRKILGHPLASIYASPLHDNTGEVEADDFMTTDELIKDVLMQGIDIEHPASLHANGFNYLFALKSGQGLLRTTFCMQASQKNPVIDPFGDVYSCYEEAGSPALRVGKIAGGGVEFFPLRETYLSRHLANLPGCLDCPVALACGGQCGATCRARTGDIFKTYCNGMKELILGAIKLSYKKHKEQTSVKGPAHAGNGL